MIEHNCDECGSTNISVCLCDLHLDRIKSLSFDDGREDGWNEGHNKALEENATERN
jgi:hypothetical protein